MSQGRVKYTNRKIKNIKSRRDLKRKRLKKNKKRDLLRNSVAKISKARFEALSYARHPFAKIISEDIEWYSNWNNSLLGILLLDKIDKDYVSIVLGRDEVGVFRLIDCKHSIEGIEDARKVLRNSLRSHTRKNKEFFYQGVSKKKKNLIFDPIVPQDDMPFDYKLLSNDEHFSPAKDIVQEIAYSFEDPDGNYIQQFQSYGFNARMWELYLYAFFHEQDFLINRDFNSPDYVVEKNNIRVCIEAVTVNSSQNGFDEDEPDNNERMEQLLLDYIPIKYGSPLFSKLSKKYWRKDHVKGNPLVFAIHDFHKKDSMMWSRQGLETYLYGAKREVKISPEGNIKEYTKPIKNHIWKNKDIPSDFFSLPDSEHISAVIHSNQATVGKFLRMGHLAEFGRRDLEIQITGQSFYNGVPLPIDYKHIVDPNEYSEYWRDSITIYHNPNAARPLDYRLFEGIAQITFRDGNFQTILPQYYPLHARTYYKIK